MLWYGIRHHILLRISVIHVKDARAQQTHNVSHPSLPTHPTVPISQTPLFPHPCTLCHARFTTSHALNTHLCPSTRCSFTPLPLTSPHHHTYPPYPLRIDSAGAFHPYGFNATEKACLACGADLVDGHEDVCSVRKRECVGMVGAKFLDEARGVLRTGRLVFECQLPEYQRNGMVRGGRWV